MHSTAQQTEPYWFQALSKENILRFWQLDVVSRPTKIAAVCPLSSFTAGTGHLSNHALAAGKLEMMKSS